MEADSTTYDINQKNEQCDPILPFPVSPGDMKLYKELINNNSDRNIEVQIVERLQNFGLLPKTVKCPAESPECKVVAKTARVIDRVQWCCESCGRRQPIRTGSIFLRLQCSLLQALQIILAWCQDADCEVAAHHFGVKPKVASVIYDRMDDVAVKEQCKIKLGGVNSVVLTEMYPGCLTRLSPDTTDQPHVHRILMMADTNRIPTSYQLQVIKDDLKKNSTGAVESHSLIEEVSSLVNDFTVPDSVIVTGSHMPPIQATATLHQLLQNCDCEMQHFLSTRVWRQAVSVCVASRDLCSGAGNLTCAAAVQRYLHTALHRLRVSTDFFTHTLTLLATNYTQRSYDFEAAACQGKCQVAPMEPSTL